MAADPSSQSESQQIDSVLAVHQLRRAGEPSRVLAGTLNANYRVETDDGPVFARQYRSDLEIERIQREHEITRWVADRGIPAIPPRSEAGGETVVEVEGRFWSIFPWVDGRVPVRGSLSSRQAESIGEVHGQIQEALAEHPDSRGVALLDARRTARLGH